VTARRARAGAGRGRRSGDRGPERALPDAARALLAIPPARFTAAREELARRLAPEDPGAAADVRALRRPVGLAWLLNRAARDAPGEVAALLSAADQLREGPDRQGLREAEEALRSSARALRLVAARAAEEEGARSVDLPRVELLLRVAASADAGTREALRQGALVREPEGLGFGGGPVSSPSGAPAGTAAGAGPRARGSAEGTAQAARRREREEAVRVRRRARELERARRTLRAAEVAAEAARREAERLEAGARAARERADRAEAHVSRARAALEALERP
jgi:hypothetical protein